MRYQNGLSRTIPQSPKDALPRSTIVGDRTLAICFHHTRTTFVQSFTRFIGVEERRVLIVSVLIGASTIVGFIHHLELSGKIGEN
jgi:hypothetical protein